MKKITYLLFCMTALSACAGLEQEAQKEVASFTQVPVSAEGQQVRIVVQKPADYCTFKGGIMGAANPNASGVRLQIFRQSSSVIFLFSSPT